MTVIGAIAVFVLSLVLTAVFAYGFRTKGPWGSTWSFFLVIVLSLWTISVWVPPAGPVWHGAPWIDLFVSGLFISFLLTALTPTREVFRRSTLNGNLVSESEIESATREGFQSHEHRHKNLLSAGSFFWMLLLFLCVLIIIGAT